jgi:type IV pilus assembly protein PilM
MFFGKKSSIIGIDLGTSGIKAVQMKKGQTGPELLNFTIVPLPEGAMADGQIQEEDTVVEALKKAVSGLNKKGADFYISISGQPVVARFITELPATLSDEEIENNFRFNAEDHIPYSSIDDVAMSFSKLGVIESEGAQKYVILLVVVQKEIVAKVMGVLQSAGITPSVMNVDIFSTLNTLASSIPDEGVISVIDIGAGGTKLSIINNGMLQFVRTLSNGGNGITTVIKRVLKLDFEEAENIKKEEGLSVMEEEENEVSEIIRAIVDDMALEIRKTFDFYRAKERIGMIDKIYLTGGTSKLKNLDAFLANELGIEVELADPLIGINIDNIEDQDLLFDNVLELTSAFGLGMRGGN